jgi:hypothetical protein
MTGHAENASTQRRMDRFMMWLATTGDRISRLWFDLLRNFLIITVLYGIGSASKSDTIKICCSLCVSMADYSRVTAIKVDGRGKPKSTAEAADTVKASHCADVRWFGCFPWWSLVSARLCDGSSPRDNSDFCEI